MSDEPGYNIFDDLGDTIASMINIGMTNEEIFLNIAGTGNLSEKERRYISFIISKEREKSYEIEMYYE